MENYNDAVNQIYSEKENEIIIGLTGRTGAGCSTAAGILKKSFDELEYEYDSSQYNDELVSEKMKRDRLKFLSLFVAETPQEIDRLIEIFPDLESVRQDINEYLERPGEVLSMFSEALRILDRNTAELMVDRMKDEMETLKAQNEELKLSSEEKDAEIARLKKLLEEQNK